MTRVYRQVLGPDDNVGRVEEDGPLVLAGGAAFFLLLGGLEEVG